jgi:hypothetical protein
MSCEKAAPVAIAMKYVIENAGSSGTMAAVLGDKGPAAVSDRPRA